MFKLVCLLSVLLVHFQNGQVNASGKIDPNLMAMLNRGEKVNVLVFFKNGVRSALDGAWKAGKQGGDRGAQISAIVDKLKKNAELSQAGVAQRLSARSGGHKYFTKFWSSNKMFVKDADAQTVKEIEQDAQVARIIKEPVFRLPIKSIQQSHKGTPPNKGRTGQRDMKYCKEGNHDGSCCTNWPLKRIKVEEAWAELGGNMGKDVIVATIDTGVRHTHEILRHNFRGDYGWFDGVNNTLEPFDPHGHGTHVTGILAGLKFGVAREAKYMSCRGCGDDTPGEECRIEHLLNCIQFMLCPTLADGSKPDCSKAPHVLSYSISGERETGPLDDDFLTLKSAGIIPVASVGNEIEPCGGTGSPANKPWVIGAGGSDWCDRHSIKSAIGPAPDGTIKPDIIAPGEWMWSADIDADDSYSAGIGTSNSCPLIAGVVALLHVRNPNLTFEEAYKFLTENTDRDIGPRGDAEFYNCSIESFKVFPNNFIGYGRMDAYATIKAQTASLLKGR